VAVLGGRVRIGLSPPQLEALASGGSEIRKVGASDLAMALFGGTDAATTVSATAFLAARTGIRVFATGGVGGVHRDDPDDVSQDLTALARIPIAVVSAGAKSILDLRRTLEALETLGVLVVGVGTDELPAFYVRHSGIPLEHRVDSVDEAVQVMAHRFETLEQGGILFCHPIDAELGLDADQVDAAVSGAMARATERGVRGKALTPFLLAEMARSTRGATVRANVALAVSNARFAGRLARAWQLRTG
jgi:pseudouridine-5'-phosphate glycosidase